MTLALPINQSFSFAPPLDRALSESARTVRRMRASAADFETTITLGVARDTVLGALENAFVEAHQESWDGYRARPVDPNTLLHAYQFLTQLPTTIPSPGVGVDPDGDIAVEWDFGARRVLSIRISRDGTLHYAGLVGHAVFHGVEPSREGIPSTISSAIQRVIGDTSI